MQLPPFPPPPRPQPLATTTQLPVPVDVPILDISYQCRHVTCYGLCLASFTEHNGLEVHLHGSVRQSFLPFLWLNHIPVHGWTTLGLSVHPSVDIGLFPLFVMNDAAVKSHVQVFMWTYVSHSFG